eukprot:1532156-Lingulodinium_polyedra.AAC.1
MRVDARVVGQDTRVGADASHGQNPGPGQQGNQHHVERATFRDTTPVMLRGAKPISQAKAQGESVHE